MLRSHRPGAAAGRSAVRADVRARCERGLEGSTCRLVDAASLCSATGSAAKTSVRQVPHCPCPCSPWPLLSRASTPLRLPPSFARPLRRNATPGSAPGVIAWPSRVDGTSASADGGSLAPSDARGSAAGRPAAPSAGHWQMPHRERGRLGAVDRTGLSDDAAHVIGHRVRADEQGLRDLEFAAAHGHQAQYLDLARAQPGRQPLGRRQLRQRLTLGGNGRRHTGHAQALGIGRTQPRAAYAHAPARLSGVVKWFFTTAAEVVDDGTPRSHPSAMPAVDHRP